MGWTARQRQPESASNLEQPPPSRARRQVGYVIAIIVNLAIVYVANNIQDWDVAPFLTDDFSRALPMINASLGVTIAVNALRVMYDGPRFLAGTEMLALAFSLAATIRVWRVFPFDFEAYSGVWEPLVRLLLIVAMIGSAIAITVQLTRLASGRRPAPGL